MPNKFNPEAKCPKCGDTKVKKLWRAASKWYGFMRFTDQEQKFMEACEHMLRTCAGCGFQWIERVMEES